MSEQKWTDEALQLLDGLLAVNERMDRIQYRLYRKMGWRPTVRQVREATAMLDERRKTQ